jgi:Xaa-Pro aminopeptidase
VDHQRRLDACRSRWQDAGVDGLLVTNLTNVRYLTGFSGTNGAVLVSGGEATFFTDPRYEARAGDLVQGADVVVYPARLTDVLPQHLTALGISKLGIEGETMTLAEREDLTSKLPGIELVTTKGVVETLRRTKDDDEIALIRAAVALADDAFAHILERLVPGVAERDIALEIELHMRRAGADNVAFPPIVGSGPLSAHIHHTAGERLIEKGDVVLIDLGCTLQGYCSDLTRTVVLGAARDEDLALYDLVARAQLAGIEAVAPGRHGAEVDGAARDVIAAAGHADRFGHGLGHGVGLDIHEAPRLHRISEDTLAPGDVVTVEPGVYLPGHGGVRIEDCVLVTDSGAEVLGSAPKDRLIEL